MTKKYKGSIEVEFDNLPGLLPQLLDTQSDNPLERLNAANQRRIFHLTEDWNISIKNASYEFDLNGDIVIPAAYDGKVTELDGAAVPMPWLVKLASFGVLRPLGAMLTASIVHNFAYKHGGLLYKNADGTTEFRKIRRDLVDKLFGDIISTVNNLPFISKIAWLAASLGYFGVRYDGKVRGGEFPATAVAVAAGVLLVLWGYFNLFGFTAGIILFGALYFVVALVISLGKKDEIKPEPTNKAKGKAEAT